jgi:hypothetical protein
MPKTLHERLLEKGWSQEEIDQTTRILYSEEKKEKHSGYQTASHPILYWAGLVVAIIGNLLISVTLIPFLMILDSSQLYIILGIVGVVFGGMFNVILKDIEQVDQSHHVVAGVFIPAIALITVYIMTGVANRFNELIKNPNTHSQIVLSVVYLVCFSSPYLLYKIKDLFYARRRIQTQSL